MYTTQDFRKNLKIEYKDHLYIIVEAKHVKPGKGAAFVKTRIKSLIDGHVLDVNFRSGDKVDRPNLESREMQYLYKDGPHWVFMDNNDYSQSRLGESAVEEFAEFLKDNLEVEVLFWDGKAVNVELPIFIDLEVTRTDPGLKGDTASGGSKPATLETGATVSVPLYISEGEVVRVDTRTKEFVERVN